MKNLAVSSLEFKRTAAEIIKGGSPNFAMILKEGTQLSILKQQKGEPFLVVILGLLIVDFQKSFNLIRPLSDDQIADLSIELVNEYWAYRFEDFVAFFQLAKKGVYGQILDRLDENTVLKMLLVYDEKRVNELRGLQTTLQESKDNINAFTQYDRNEQNRGFTDRGGEIGDYINRLKSLKNE